MMSESLSSKVLVTEEPPRTRSLPAAAAAVTGIVGTASWGPLGDPTLCTSFDEFKNKFGGYTATGSLAPSAQAFFANGGSRLYAVRTSAYGDVSRAETTQAKAATAAATAGQKSLAVFSARHPGSMGNQLRIDMRQDNVGIHIDVSLDGRQLERWRGLSPHSWYQVIDRDSRYLRSVQAEQYDGVIDAQAIVLTGGDDGISDIQDSDFTGDSQARTGMRALDRVLDLSILILPDASAEVQRQALSYCQSTRRGSVIALLDVPRGLGAEDAAKYVVSERLAESSEHGGIYWPHVRVLNPAPHALDGQYIAVAPSAFVAGVLGRLAASRPGGLYLPPAGLEAGQLAWAAGLDQDDCLDEAKRDLVYPARVNPLNTGPGLPIYIDGSRTLKTSGLCPWIAQRRGLSFIARSLKTRLEYLRHRPLDTALMSEAYRDVTSFLMGQMRQGAFISRDPKTAFRVSVGRSADDPALQVSIGIAFARPAEFIWLQVSVNVDGTPGSFA